MLKKETVITLNIINEKYEKNKIEQEEFQQIYNLSKLDISSFQEENEWFKKNSEKYEENFMLKEGDFYKNKFIKLYSLYKELKYGELYELKNNYLKQKIELKKLKEENNKLLIKNKNQEKEIEELRGENT